MADLKLKLALGSGKLIRFLLSFSSSGATAAPGLVALKIDPQLIEKLSRQLSFSILISGTNGKTTTARILASILKSAQIPYYHNRTGSNLLRGIASTLINSADIKGKLQKKIGLWEVDEAAFPLAVNRLKPRIIVLNNLFRDQLDRYGEVDTLAKKWRHVLRRLTADSIVILNADDPTVASLGKELQTQVQYYGIKDKSLKRQALSHASDATFCPKCLHPLNYEACFFSHLGIYNCPECGTIQPNPDTVCRKLHFSKNHALGLVIEFKSQRQKLIIKPKLAGIYNAYNTLSAASVARCLDISNEKIIKGISLFRPAFGRLEQITFKNKSIKILLAKNPTGLNEVLNTLISLTKSDKAACLFILNDLIADGRDVSWIWDVDFSLLKKSKIEKIIVSGIRAEDLHLRLKYGNLIVQLIKVKNLGTAINTLINQRINNLVIVPTYTAMLETRKILTRMKLTHSSWED